jgi:CRP/FNR family cyclic AMP-dependent transcriptional regulator
LIRRLLDNVIVRGTGFWGLLGDTDRATLIAAARPRVFPGGAVLCMEGEPTTHVFILLAGWVKVITVTREGQEIVAALRGDGDVIGEIAGEVTGYRTATVQAIGSVRTLIVGSERFESFLDAHPGASHAYRRATAELRQAAYEHQRSQVLSSGAQRLACLLLDLAERRGTPGQQGGTAPFPLTQEELASLVGASRSTITRALQDWRARHIIATAQRHITILDRPQLRRIAGRSSHEPLSAQGLLLSPLDVPHECGPLSR